MDKSILNDNLKNKKRKVLKVIFGRTAMLFASLFLQAAIMLLFMLKLSEYAQYYYGTSLIIAIVMVLYIVNKDDNPSYQMVWAVLVAAFPFFGVIFYLFVHLQSERKMMDRKITKIAQDTAAYMQQDQGVLESLKKEEPQLARFTQFMNRIGPFPMCKNSDAKYYPVGDDWYVDMLERLKQAKRFIFIEFFIVDFGIMLDEVMEILKKKAAAGVEVRFMYDGTCTFFRLPHNFPKYLESLGIECRVFLPIKPAWSTYQNNRDHRKIVVIDGEYAYTGGVNLADEYINQKERFGHWKDTAVEITGDAVNTFTVLFLQNWNIQSRHTEDISGYIVKHPDIHTEGCIMGYTDSPFDKVDTGETVYMDMLYTAVDYVHIMTPYLIFDNEMMTALAYAAGRGVDVKIIMPHITDKPYAYMVARLFYEKLIKKGVKIYEYTPGFVHAKEFISDDKKAVVGSINLDYRSLYLNYECAAYLYKVAAVKSAEHDFCETLKKCQEITLEDCRNYSRIKLFLARLMWIFSPLM